MQAFRIPFARTPPRAVLATLGAAVVVAALVAYRPADDRATQSRAAAEAAPAVAAVAQIDPDDALVVVYEQNLGTRSEIRIISHSTGAPLGVIHANDNPMVLVRRSTRELLVSDVLSSLPGGRGEPMPRLVAYQLGAGLRTVGEPITLPDRNMYTVFTQGLMLSRDERLLYYVQRRDCGPTCNEVGVGVVDLMTRAVHRVELPINCGTVHLSLGPAGEPIAMCPIGASVWRLDGASATRVASFGGTGVYGGVGEDGRAYAIDMRGTLHVAGAGNVTRRELVTERPVVFSAVTRWALPDGRIALGTRPSGGSPLDSLVIVDTRKWEIGRIALPPGTMHVAPIGRGRIAATDGRDIVVIDENGSVNARFPAPAGRWPWLVAP